MPVTDQQFAQAVSRIQDLENRLQLIVSAIDRERAERLAVKQAHERRRDDWEEQQRMR